MQVLVLSQAFDPTMPITDQMTMWLQDSGVDTCGDDGDEVKFP